jgi:hypothetical protein
MDDKKIAIRVYYQDKAIGDAIIEPVISQYKVTFKVEISNVIDKKKMPLYEKVFKYPELIKCWFESGHALVNGMVFKTGYQDVSYDKFLWADFENYKVKKEKPGTNPQKPKLADTDNAILASGSEFYIIGLDDGRGQS